jgi:hypothetical protein
MALHEIDFELSAEQYERMDYPNLRQGQSLSVILDAGVLLPEPTTFAWFVVQPTAVSPQLAVVGRGIAAFAGQIEEADLARDGDQETATLLVNCGAASLRVTCAPQADGRLPFGTWETRFLIGHGPLYGIVEDDYTSPIGEMIGVTIWGFRRLVLTPGDPLFGQWVMTDELIPTPIHYDRVIVTARIHARTGF